MDNLKIQPPYSDITYDWNKESLPGTFKGFVDETIRDGLQAPYCPAISLDERLLFIDYMAEVKGITDVIVGMSGLGESNREDIRAILEHCKKYGQSLMPWILCRSSKDDIQEAAALMKETGCSLGINLFQCFSDIRIYVEGWDYNRLINSLTDNLIYCKAVFPKIRVAIEDATRTRPEVLGEVVPRLVELGVDRIVIADTAGVATPRGIESIFDCIRSICKDISMGSTAFEFHGHNDRGLAVANSLQSILSGAQYVHGTMMGIGERNGNAALDTIILNLSGYCDKMINWESLDKYYGHCERLFQKVVENSYPYYGRNSYTSSTGTHCAAIKKAIDLGRVDISRNLFSPPSHLSKITDFTFLISHLSGRKNVEEALKQMGISYDDDLIMNIMAYAKKHRGTLQKDDIISFVKQS